MEKICSSCRSVKTFPDDFYKDHRKPSGHRGRCKPCDKITIGKWFRKHTRKKYPLSEATKTKERERHRRYFSHLRATSVEYRAMKKSADRKYRATLKGRVTKVKAKAKRRSLTGDHQLTAPEWKRTIEAFNRCCAYCSSMDKLTVDHVIPIHANGGTVLGNVVPACLSCNSSKQHRSLSQWATAEQIEYVSLRLQSLF